MYQPGDVVLLQFPFSDGSSVKLRPALILLDTGDADVVVARITSQSASSPYDVTLTAWQSAGLLLPSIVRVHKVATLSKRLIERRLGHLQPDDMDRVRKVLASLCAQF